MITVLSPAKSLDFEKECSFPKTSEPVFPEYSKKLAEKLKKKDPDELVQLMNISDKLALLNAERFQAWQYPHDEENTQPAIFAFNGDVYDGLEATTFSHDDLEYAQNHLRIFSGLYGVLRPLDLIMPYRLEMGIKLKTSKNQDLYSFWKGTITRHINESMEKAGTQIVVNLASIEYFSAIDINLLQGEIIKPVFKDKKGNDYKIISFWAKKARGAMAAFIIKNRIENPEELRAFDGLGYIYDENLSNKTELVFTRS
ncbi:MAG: peroxide stress protein YaaA [Cyclobacteriaceae bacterium]|nr:peroxide stress protein YaaA [Cyclobacteriaceae bacterium]